MSSLVSGRRLIQDEQARIGGQGARDLQPALLTVGQVAGGFILQLGQTHDLQKLHRLPAHPGLLLAVQVEGSRQKAALGVHVLGNENILKNSQIAEETDILEGTGQAHFGDLIRRFAEGGLPCEFFHIAAKIIMLGTAGGMLAQIGPAIEIQAAIGGGIDPRHHIKGGGFAGAVGADEGHDLALAHFHRKVIHGYHAAELHCHIFQL